MLYLTQMNKLVPVLELVHELQKERGSSALYLRLGEEAKESMLRQRVRVDTLLLECRTSLESEVPGFSFSPILQSRDRALLSTEQDAEAYSVIQTYSREIIAPLLEWFLGLCLRQSGAEPSRLTGILHFLQFKERVGMERALGTQVVSMEHPDEGQLEKIRYFLEEQESYEKLAFGTMSEDCSKWVRQQMDSDSGVLRLEEFNQCLKKGGSLEPLTHLRAVDWFEMVTTKMNLLHGVSIHLLNQLFMTPKDLQYKTLYGLPKDLEMYRKTISRLPLFLGLPENSIDDVLRDSRLMNLSKGVTLFFEGEQAQRIYLVLSGWLKCIRTNNEGIEGVLRMVGEGDCLLEILLLKPGTYPVTAQVVEKASLISIPASTLRQAVKTYPTLALNMLTTVAQKSQDMMAQVEQLTLKSAIQRVGWFFLKTCVIQGGQIPTYRLPYDKALIASLLGMKPETFSRALQALKDQNIEIDRDVISLPDLYALCGYCDSEIKKDCRRAGTSGCAHIDPH